MRKNLGMLVLIGLIAWSCDRTDGVSDDPVVNNVASQTTVTPEEAENIPVAGEEAWVMPEMELMEAPVVREGSETEEFTLVDDGTGVESAEDPLMLWNDDAVQEGRDGPCNIHGLSPLQRRALKRAHRRYCQCACGIHQAIHQIHRQIIANANARLRQLIRKLHNGQLTPQQFMQKVHQLARRVRQAMRNHPQKQQLLRALRTCKRRYGRAAHRILNDRQFQAWLQCSKARRCRCGDHQGPQNNAAE